MKLDFNFFFKTLFIYTSSQCVCDLVSWSTEVYY